MGTNLIPSVDSDTKQLHDDVRARIAANLADPATAEGAAILAAQAATPSVRSSVTAARSGSLLRGSAACNESMFPDVGPITVTPAFNSRKRYIATRDVTSLRLIYGNIYSVDSVPTSSITVKAAIEYGENMYPAFAGGGRARTLDEGALVAFDPVGVLIPAGAVFYVRTWVSGSAIPLQGSPSNLTQPSWGEGCDMSSGVTQPDLTTSGTIAANASSHYSPVVVSAGNGGDAVATVGIIGDSIAAGVGDESSFQTGRGFVRRALNNNIPYTSIAVQGEQASHRRVLRMPLLDGSSHIICALGVNDIYQSASLETLQSINYNIWRQAALTGAKIYQTTLTPRTTSTDAWATTANQAPLDASQEAVRVAYNTWLRDGAPLQGGAPAATGSAASGTIRAGKAGHPLTGYFDVADAAEPSRNAGVWVPNGTVDGVHPVANVHNAMAAKIDVSKLVL